MSWSKEPMVIKVFYEGVESYINPEDVSCILPYWAKDETDKRQDNIAGNCFFMKTGAGYKDFRFDGPITKMAQAVNEGVDIDTLVDVDEIN